MATPWETFCTPSPEIAEAMRDIMREDRTCGACRQEFRNHAGVLLHQRQSSLRACRKELYG